MSEAERLRAQGLDVTTVGEILDGRDAPIGPMKLPVIAGYPVEFPEPGIYFGMDEATYHAIPALSSGGIKDIAASPMLYWEDCPWLNPECEEKEQKDHFDLGHAYECRIIEGKDAFEAGYAYDLDKADFDDSLLESTDEIKAEIMRYGRTPASRIGIGEFVPDPKKPGEEKELTRAAKKEDWIDQLLEIDPDSQIWDRIVSDYAKANHGKTLIPAKHGQRIEVAARVVGLDPEQRAAVTGGYPQVSLFWICPKTGVPKKARADYLKIRAITDAKTYQNQKRRSPEAAIAQEIANYHYNVQPSHYFEGAQEVRKLVRASGAAAVHVWDGEDRDCECADFMEKADWAIKWASNKAPDEWVWLFIMTGPTVTRLAKYPRGVNKAVTDEICSRAARRLRLMAETYGTDPWLDLAPMIDLADEDIHPRALEI